MAITYPLTPPSSPSFKRFALKPSNIAAMTKSQFTGQQKVYEHAGEWWIMEGTLPPMTRAQAEPWRAFLTALRGPVGTFYMGEKLGKTARGIATGTPKVNGANAAGVKTLNTKGWTASQTGILKAGDYLQVGSGTTQRLHRVLVDANSDGSGLAAVEIFPCLREALADDAVITISSCKGVFRLTQVNEDTDAAARMVYLGFAAIEAI